MHSATKPTRHTTVITIPTSSKVRKLTIHLRPPAKITLHLTPPRKLKLNVKPSPKITLHVTPPRKLKLKLTVKPPPPTMSISQYARVDAWIREQAHLHPDVKRSSINSITPAPGQQLLTPPNTASSEPSLDETFVVKDQFTPPPTTTTASATSVVSRGGSRTSYTNVNALTRPMVDVSGDAMGEALRVALDMQAIGLGEYKVMVDVLGKGKQ